MARPSSAKLLSARNPQNVRDEMLILADVMAKTVALATVMTAGRWQTMPGPRAGCERLPLAELPARS